MDEEHRYDSPDWPLPAQRRDSIASSIESQSTSILSLTRYLPTPSPATSPLPGGPRISVQSASDEVIRLELNPGVTVSFLRGGRLFKLRYAYIDICKSLRGTLRFLELGGATGQQSAFTHTFQNTKLPMPHLEQPKLAEEKTYRVSFLEEQTVQSNATIFTTQLSYTFDTWDDCVRFQEILLASELVFIAGIAEAKSKGRGEECISQNLRILRGANDRQVILFFANSQRKDRKRYVSIPVNCIESVDPGKKPGRPVALHLHPNFDILSEMKVLHIRFLDDQDRQEFCQLLSERPR
ncbi:hypothetical protein DTO271D3_4414 [Paecilomyces variotii]|nr:hypothetical protein DTO212C5_1332 [Paecilomyces variotii]KAJ9315247.1 hypothetical protein DTO271D3_4414 [Paecilomyces variotii]KAJ9328116.1 hypothetical protein DTO027B3_1153 [Paecilomyces variotii]KAJ9337297.1 hypothetical protein DTO027B5_1095 [Paecilomyces variotii]KAJ9360498.1 hypothetical protein DTO280E4_4215 [Paecilomyces variotii]